MGWSCRCPLRCGPGSPRRARRRAAPATPYVDRLVELADLVVLGHVRVEVILAGETRRLDLGVQGGAIRMANSTARSLKDRQRARESETDRANVRVGLVPKDIGAAAEQLVGGLKFAVHLQPDDGLPLPHVGRPAHRAVSDRAAVEWAAASTARRRGTSRLRPARWPRSARRRQSVVTQAEGYDIAGCPDRFEGWCRRRRGTWPTGRPPWPRDRRRRGRRGPDEHIGFGIGTAKASMTECGPVGPDRRKRRSTPPRGRRCRA